MRSRFTYILVCLLAALVLLAACAPAAASIPTQPAEAATAIPTDDTACPGLPGCDLCYRRSTHYTGQWLIGDGSGARLRIKNYHPLFRE